MRVLICGSRTWDHPEIIQAVVIGCVSQSARANDDFVLVHGAAPGADTIAAKAAAHAPLRVEAYPADWDTHGKAAGPIRNQRMLTEGRPDLVLAFVDKPLAESRGTSDMVRRARKAGVPTYIIRAGDGDA